MTGLSKIRLYDCFISKKYTAEDNRFIRDRKMTQKNILIYSYSKKLYHIYTEAIRFFTIMLSNDFQTISNQAIGKQRTYIDQKLFIQNEYEKFHLKNLKFLGMI